MPEEDKKPRVLNKDDLDILDERIEEAREVPNQTEDIELAKEKALEDLRGHSHKGIETPKIRTNDLIRDVDTKIRIYMSAGHNIGSTSTTIVRFNTEDYDLRGEFDTTAYKFTAHKEGYYHITATIGWVTQSGVSDEKKFQLYIYKNGSVISKSKQQCASTGNSTLSNTVVDVLKLNKDDYIEIKAYHDATGNHALEAGDGGDSYLTIIKVF